MKKKFVDYFMGIAELTSKLSYATRLKVGAVIVKDNQIIGTGYNGMPAGWDNCCEYDIPKEVDSDDGIVLINHLATRPEVLHAESNAILKVAQSTESSSGATLFCTHAPCIECAKLIYQAGIVTVYYKEHYRNDSGIRFLQQGDVNVHQYPYDA